MNCCINTTNSKTIFDKFTIVSIDGASWIEISQNIELSTFCFCSGAKVELHYHTIAKACEKFCEVPMVCIFPHDSGPNMGFDAAPLISLSEGDGISFLHQLCLFCFINLSTLLNMFSSEGSPCPYTGLFMAALWYGLCRPAHTGWPHYTKGQINKHALWVPYVLLTH